MSMTEVRPWDPPTLTPPELPASPPRRSRGPKILLAVTIAALLAVTVGALVAIGGGDADDSVTLPPVEAYSLAAAVEGTVDARTVSFDLTVSTTDLGSVTVSGAVDNESRVMTVSTDLGSIVGLDEFAGPDSIGQVDLVLDGENGVLYLGGVGGLVPGSSMWISADLAVLAEQAGQSLDEMRAELFVDPTESARLLLDAENATEIGTETIDGVETKHYQVTVDLAAALAAASQAELADRGVPIDELDIPDTVVYDVWVTADNQLRRAGFDVDVAGQQVSVVFDMVTSAEALAVEIPADAFDITGFLDF